MKQMKGGLLVEIVPTTVCVVVLVVVVTASSPFPALPCQCYKMSDIVCDLSQAEIEEFWW